MYRYLYLIIFPFTFLFSCSNFESKKIELSNADSLKTKFDSLIKIEAKEKADPLIYAELARVSFALKEYKKTTDYISKALQLDASHAERYLLSPAGYKKILDSLPNYKYALLQLGEVYFYYSNDKESFKYLKAALAQDQTLADAHYFLGLNFKNIGFENNALTEFNRTTELESSHFHAWLQLGLIYSEHKDPKAEVAFNNAHRIQPKDLNVLYARGKYYQDLEKYNLAEADYHTMLGIDSLDYRPYYNIGFIHFSKMDYEDALTYFSKSISANDENANAYLSRGYCYQNLNKQGLASLDFLKAFSLNPNDPDIKKAAGK